MGVKPDKWIIENSKRKKMIEPFAGQQVRKGVISYGAGSYGYDVRLSDEFIRLKKETGVIDPKGMKDEDFIRERKGKFPRGSFGSR